MTTPGVMNNISVPSVTASARASAGRRRRHDRVTSWPESSASRADSSNELGWSRATPVAHRLAVNFPAVCRPAPLFAAHWRHRLHVGRMDRPSQSYCRLGGDRDAALDQMLPGFGQIGIVAAVL